MGLQHAQQAEEPLDLLLLPELTGESGVQQQDKSKCCLSVWCLSCRGSTPAALNISQKEATAAASTDPQHARLQRSDQSVCRLSSLHVCL